MNIFILLKILIYCILLPSCLHQNVSYKIENDDNKLSEKTNESLKILHIDRKNKIITFKSQTNIPISYYRTINKEGGITGIIKVNKKIKKNFYESDILEGFPSINDSMLLIDNEDISQIIIKYPNPIVD